MTTPISDRVWCTDYTTRIHVEETEHGLELTADVGDQDTTVVLDTTAARKLRLLLARYERRVAQATATAAGEQA